MKRNADRGQHRQAARAIKPPRIASRVLDAHERTARWILVGTMLNNDFAQ